MTHSEAIAAAERSPESRGRTLDLKWLRGGRLCASQAIQAKCFECMNRYIDGRDDCRITVCPLYPWMPYRKSKKATRIDSTAVGGVPVCD